jgi:glycosyltransferase involved in cell wall biosynthesis
MNIGIDIRSLSTMPRTGVGEYTFELIEAILNTRTAHTFFLFNNSLKEKTFLIPPSWQQENVYVSTYHVPNKILNAAIGLFSKPKLDNLTIKKHRVPKLDCFFSPNLNYTALSKQTKHLITIHDLSFELFPHFFSKKQQLWHTFLKPKKQTANSHHIITPSHNTKRDLTQFYNIHEQKITVIYPGIKDFLYKEKNTTIQNEHVKKAYALPDHFMLFLGTLEQRKNIPGVIKAFENSYDTIYKITNKDFHLVLAGAPGYQYGEIKKIIRNSKYNKKIITLGYIESQHKPTIYSLSSLFLYPSFYEGFGFPVLEAMAMGVPVITSNRSSLPEISESAAFLIDPHRTEQCVKATISILTNPLITSKLIEKGLKQAQKFQWSVAAKQWLDCIEK